MIFEIFLILVEIISLMSLFILIFIYSILSSDTLITIISFSIFLIFLIPFHFLLENFEVLIKTFMLENLEFCKAIVFFSRIITYIMGFILFFELIYLILFN